MAYTSTFIPLSSCQAGFLDYVLEREYSYIEKVRIRSYFTGIFTYDFDDFDSLKQNIIERGNVFFNHLMYCMKRDSILDDEIALEYPGHKAYYKFAWLCVMGNGEYFILCKGTQWQASEQSARLLGESFFPEMDFPDDADQPQFLLAVESKTRCQQPKLSSAIINLAAIEKECADLSVPFAIVEKVGLVEKMPWRVYDGHAEQNVYRVPFVDGWYYSFEESIHEAMYELLYM